MSAVLRHVLLLQRDVPAAARFYRDGLGLVVNVCTERWAELGNAASAPGASPGVSASAASAPETVIALKHVDSEAPRVAGSSASLSFPGSHLDQSVNDLLRAGASLDGPILYPPRGKVAALRAPDGHMLGLFEPAEGTTDAQSTVRGGTVV